MNTVNTVGITSASFCWNQGRCSYRQNLTVRGGSSWRRHGTCSSPTTIHLEAGGEEYRFAVIAFFIVCAVAGVPSSWNKTSGGETVTWVGFELLHQVRDSSVYLAKKGRLVQKVDDRGCEVPVLCIMASFEKGLGPGSCTSREHWSTRGRFLGPLYRFMSLHPARLGQGSAAICFLLPEAPRA